MGGLSFLNPVFLIALPAVGIPILIHLVNRRRPKVMDFAAIDFILRSHRRTVSMWRLRQILLLLARVGVVLMLVLAFARPYLSTFAARRGPVNLAVVVDDSYSMQYRRGAASCFDRAVSAAEDLLRSLHGDDNAALIVGETRKGLTPNINALIEDIRAARCSYAPSDAAAWIEGALDILGGSTLANKHITLFTDLAAHGWAEERFAAVRERLAEADCAVSVVDVGAEQSANAAVADVRVAYGKGKEQGAAEATATIANFGAGEIKGLRCELLIEGKSAAVGFADVPAGATVEKMFTCTAPPGKALKSRVEIAADPLAADNTRWFILDSPPQLNVLLVDGSPGTHRVDAETFYLEGVLRPADESDVQIVPVVVTPEEMKAEKLSDYDVIFLCNAAFVEQAECGQLYRFLRNGGGLFVSLGDQVDDEQYNSAMRTLIPRGLWDRKTFQSGVRMGEIDASHPVFKVFRDADMENLRSAVFTRLFLLKPQTDTSTRVVMGLEGGIPLLIETQREPGRIMLFTATLDRAWGNLPILPTFLPLMRQITKHLAGVSDAQPATMLLVGEPQRLFYQDAESMFDVTDPRGARKQLGPARTVVFKDTSIPGIYDVSPGRPFAVNVDARRESNLARIPVERVNALLGRETSVAGTDREEGRLAPTGVRTPIWGRLLAALLCLVLVESVLAKRA
ncbi:MAG: BatA domain-containing protein [Planctomycetota bacterium]